MSIKKSKESSQLKVFIITSNPSIEDTKITNLSSSKGLEKMEGVLSKTDNYKDELFSIKVYSFDVNKDTLKKDYKNGDKPYKGEIKIKYDGINFKGIINFKEIEHSFIYNFKFEITKNKMNNKEYPPPKSIQFSNLEQFLIYKELIKKLGSKDGDAYFISLFNDSIELFEKKDGSSKIPFDFYLELFKMCYKTKELKKILEKFDINKIQDSNKIIVKNYSAIFNVIEKHPNYIEKKLNGEDPKKYNEYFFTLLLYYRIKYEKKTMDILFKNSSSKEYFKNILINHHYFFYQQILPKEIFNEIFNQTPPLSYNGMVCLFYYFKTIEEMLEFIVNNKEKVYNCCLSKRKINKLTMKEFNIFPTEKDDFKKVLDNLETIIEYEQSQNQFILFDDDFWNNFIHPNIMKNPYNLVLIHRCILKCKEIDKSLNDNMNEDIINTALEMLKNGNLKNVELLKFIKENSYFEDSKYANICYRPLELFQGIDLDNLNEEFYKLWDEINMFKKYSFLGNQGPKQIIEKVEHMKDFGKLLTLFHFPDENWCDKGCLSLLFTKFLQLLKKNTEEDCPNLISDASLLIRGIDKKSDIKYNLEIIQKNINSEVVKKIYLDILSKQIDMSRDLINTIINFFINENKNLIVENIITLLKASPNINFTKFIFNKIYPFVVKADELFSINVDIKSFKILDWIQKEKLFEKNADLYNTEYGRQTIKFKNEILSNIKTGNIKYNKISDYTANFKNLKEKLEIILFHNEEDFKDCTKSLTKYIFNIKNIIKEIDKYLNILAEFYEEKYNNQISTLSNLEEIIKSGNLNVLENEKIKKELDEVKSLFPDIEEKNLLRNSIFFMHFLKNNKSNPKNQLKKDDEIFELTLNDFQQLKLLFEKDWMGKIEQSIIKNCYDSIKSMEKNIVKNEIKSLKKYFKMENINDNDLDKITDNLIVLSKKEKIFLTLNGCLCFIEEVKAEKTEFYDSLKNFKDNLQQNIKTDKITYYGIMLEKYGINILNSKVEEQDYINILHSLYRRKGSLDFLIHLTLNDCRDLHELCSEIENILLTTAEIQDMEKCSKFVKELIAEKNNKTDLEFITSFKNKVQETKNIGITFENYANHFRQIQELLTEKFDKSKATLKKIEYILLRSEFTLSINNNSEKYFTFEAFYYNEENEKNPVSYDELIELRRRAMLTKKLGDENSEKERKIFTYNKTFSQKINEILKINKLLQTIAEKGYSENIEIKVEIKDLFLKFHSTYDNFKSMSYEECRKHFNDIYYKVTKAQDNYYRNEKTKLIRYIYGRQFILLNNHFQNILNDISKLEPFLKYITNDLIDSSSDFQNLCQYTYDDTLDNNDKYKCLLENINKFLEQFLKNNSISLENIYNQNIVQEKFKGEFKGLYTYLLEDDKFIQRGEEEHILIWYYFLTGNAPMAQTVLLCNEETTSEEIISFMYRAFLCEYNVVFMVGKLNLLTPQKRQVLTSMINMLYIGHEKEMKSCLVFVYSDKNLTIVQYLERIKEQKSLKHKDRRKDEEYSFDENVQIIYSDKSGRGKSTYIKKQAEKKGKRYIHFPFGGEFSRENVINRLKKIKINNKNASGVIIHLDLCDSKQIDLMKNFLYSILITKLYGQNEKIFYLSKNVEIKIEIPNGFTNFFYKFPILDMFKNKYEMNLSNLEPLIIDNQIDSNIQIVCNYLKLYEEGKICDVDLYIKNISIHKESDDDSEVEERIAESLPQKECQRLIFKYIKVNKDDNNDPTYYQVNSFINVLSGQLKKFSMNYQLTARYLIDNGTEMNDNSLKRIRQILMNSFIQNTIYFTKGAYNSLLDSNDESYKVEVENGIYDENKQEKKAIEVLSIQSQNQDMISFSKIKPSLIFFHENEGQEYSIISTCDKNDGEYSELLKLRTVPALIAKSLTQNNEIIIPDKLNDYRNYTHKDFLYEIKEILNIKNPVLNKDKNDETNKKGLKSIEEIVGEYVFTADNFIKMILILLRIRENIPTIMMGETGCGKTSLIRKLSELMNNGKSKMKILNIHAGITDKEIVDFLEQKRNDTNKSILEEAEELYHSEQLIKIEKQKLDQKYFEKKLWIFLDEINTCNCMGLICELMTKHSCQGRPLPKSIIFIGACNPYRKLFNEEALNGLELKGANKRVLAYTVNPLPFSLLNFIFNFGRLTQKDEEKYIENMIIKPMEMFYLEDSKIEEKKMKKKEKEDNEEREENKEEIEIENSMIKTKDIKDYLSDELYEQYKKLKNIAKDSLVQAQNYVRKTYGDSSVSLREIRRFSLFYEFFVHYLRKRRNLFKDMNYDEFENLEDNIYKDMKDFDLYKYAIDLSIFICFYLRLTNKDYRKEFSFLMNKIFGFNFEEFPKKEEKYIVDNIEMKEGIAKNRALLENIFALFVCINAKVPLFIVGKPGCSKSLSVQLLSKSMKGEELSDNKLFNKLPKIMVSSYQGSLSSTSEGVKSVFERARKSLENANKKNKNVISMFFFDEMGLAEHSKNNPLKVIHSELEYDLNEGSKKIAFVGISNWVLDASKMNRGIHLSITQPDLQDLTDTAETIAKTYDDTLATKNKSFFSNLAQTYFNYKEILAKHEKYQDFHGSRDFYHLIKNSTKSLLNKVKNTKNIEIDEQVKQTTGIDSLERNFGGLELKNGDTSLELIKKEFKRKFENVNIQKKYDVLKRIEENINDKDSRYLLLSSKSSVSYYLLKDILSSKNINKDSSFYIGSRFVKDQQSEEYILKILNKVQLQMEQDKVLILTDLESVYPALYDLFNQNFTTMGTKNYARIAIGNSNNTLSFVNKNFRCLILVDQNSIEEQQPPFLNRFEKHMISFEYLLPKKIAENVEKIYENIYQFIEEPDDEKLKLSYNLKTLLVNCDKEEIQGIAYKKYNENKDISYDDLYEYVLEKVVPTLPQDLILFMNFYKPKNTSWNQILKFYKRGVHSNLYNFLQTMDNPKNIIYTFTNIDEPLFSKNNNIIETKMFGKINKDNIIDILISSLSSETNLENELEKFYLEKDKRILVIRLNPNETDILNYVKFFIENYIKEKNNFEENNDNKKAFLFLIHMNRIFQADKEDKKKSKYIKRNEMGELISHLSDFNQIFIDNLNEENSFTLVELMNMEREELFRNCLDLNEEFVKNIFEIFSYINYEFIINIPGINKSTYSKKLIEYLLSDEELRKDIINCVINQTKNETAEKIFENVLKNNLITEEDVGMVSVLKKYLAELFKKNLAKFIFKAEKDHFLSPFLFNELQIKKLQNEKDIFINANIKNEKKDEIINNKNEIQKEKNLIIEEIKNENLEIDGKEKNEINTDEKNVKEINEINTIEKNVKEKNEINIEEKIEKEKNEINKDEKYEKEKNEINTDEKYEEQKKDNDIKNKTTTSNYRDIKNNILIKVLEKNYLDKLDTSLTKNVNKNMKNNQVSLLFGLKLPGIKIIINKISLYIKAKCADRYIKKENNFREIEDKETFNKYENIFSQELKKIRKNVDIEINRNEIFKILNELQSKNPEDSNQFFEFLLDDYYLIFLSQIIPNFKECHRGLEDYILILKKMIYLRFNDDIEIEETSPLKSFSKKILWLESYSEHISSILNIYQNILAYEKDLFNKIEKMINDEVVSYEVSERSPEFSKKVNSPFFYILEPLLKIIISNIDLYKKLEKQDFLNFIISLKTIKENASKIYSQLYIYSKETFTIEEFLNIQQRLNSLNKSNKENLLEVINMLSEHSKLATIVSNEEPIYNSNELCKNMDKLYEFLNKNLGNTENFAGLMINICTEELKKISNYHYRKKLVEIVLKNSKIISLSYKFLSIILKNLLDFDISLIENNIENLIKHNNQGDYIYLDVINETKNDTLNEIILNIFENGFTSYFEQIPQLSKLKEKVQDKYFKEYFEYIRSKQEINPTYILSDTSLKLLKDCLNTLENIYTNSQLEENKREKINNELLLTLYCIAYVKMYLFKCIYFIHFNKKEFRDFAKIRKEIEGTSKNNFRKMIKIYIFKIFFHLLNRDYFKFKDYHYANHEITFKEEFNENFIVKKNSILNYYLLPIEDYEEFQKIERKFQDYWYNNFGGPVIEFKDYIEQKGLDYFYVTSSNIIISKLSIPNYISDGQEYSNYSSFIKNLFDANLKLPDIKKKLFLIFSNEAEFCNKIQPKILCKDNPKIDSNLLEILLYTMRICLQISDNEKSDEYLYAHIISPDIKKVLNQNCIPGNNLLDNIYVNNYKMIEEHLNTLDHDIGAYVCSCGLYYAIPPCGFPDTKSKDEEEDKCLNCSQPIGAGPRSENYTGCHFMVIRDGHYRIFKDEQQRIDEFNAYGDYDEGIPNMLLDDYRNKIIEPIIEENKFGISKVQKQYFEKMNITIRKLSIIGYRLLNLVIYSQLFYAHCLGYITDEDLDLYVSKDMTIMDMIETDWNIIKDCLQTKGVQIIQVFMNMIFKELCDKLANCKNLKTSKEREKFEEEIEQMLEKNYKEYDEYQKRYIEKNKTALQLDKSSMKSLVLEIIDENEYDQKNYPFYKLLFMTTYPSVDSFKHELKKIPNYEKKYPLLNLSLIMENKCKYLIKYLPKFNSFINFMIDNYSYKISRVEASTMLIKDQEIYKNDVGGFKKMFNEFIQIWEKIKESATKFQCNPDMEPITLSEGNSLDYFLNDNAEIGKGMYIASALQNFVSWQNNFLDKLIDALKNGGILHHYLDNLKKTIDVQNAKQNDVLNFDEMEQKLIGQIFENSKRNIFKMENKVSYQNYRQFLYDFDSMERVLGKIILTGKVKFKSDKDFRFVTYNLEGFRGNKSSVFTDFIEQYQPIELTDQIKQKIYNCLKKKIKNKSKDLQRILFSIQLLIYYLTQEYRESHEEINIIIKQLPEYVKLTDECIHFFEEQKNIKVCELSAVYSFLEVLCFSTIESNLNDYYKQTINDDIKEKILKSFEQVGKINILLLKN